MPQPIFRLGRIVETVVEVPARVCGPRKRGWKSIMLPVGIYRIVENWRDMQYYHDQEYSDGYTYRLRSLTDRQLRRVSVWQNDLYEAIHPHTDEE